MQTVFEKKIAYSSWKWFLCTMLGVLNTARVNHFRCCAIVLIPSPGNIKILKNLTPPPPRLKYILFFLGGGCNFVNFKYITRSIHSSLFSMHYKTGQVWSGIKTIQRPKEFYYAPWSEILGSTTDVTIQVTSNTETIQFQVISMTCKPKLDYYLDQLGLPTI